MPIGSELLSLMLYACENLLLFLYNVLAWFADRQLFNYLKYYGYSFGLSLPIFE